MKLTVAAFEALYQACDPVHRKSFFRTVREKEFNLSMVEEGVGIPAAACAWIYLCAALHFSRR